MSAVLGLVVLKLHGRRVRVLWELVGGVRRPSVLDRPGCRRTAMRPCMTQGVQDADAEEEQGEQYESQGDVDRLHAAAHPALSVRPAPVRPLITTPAASPYR